MGHDEVVVEEEDEEKLHKEEEYEIDKKDEGRSGRDGGGAVGGGNPLNLLRWVKKGEKVEVHEKKLEVRKKKVVMVMEVL